MIKTFHLTAFDDTEFEKFIEFSNNYGECIWNIVINSNGGDTPTGAAITEILELKEKMYPNTVIISVIKAFSSAFNLLCKTSCLVNILEECRGMVHQSRWFLDMNANSVINKNGENYQEMIKKEMSIHLKNYSRIYSKFLTSDELNRFKKGEDVYFDYNRMKLIFNNKQKQKKNESSKSRSTVKKSSNSTV